MNTRSVKGHTYDMKLFQSFDIDIWIYEYKVVIKDMKGSSLVVRQRYGKLKEVLLKGNVTFRDLVVEPFRDPFKNNCSLLNIGCVVRT